jgi:hypothetical protein
MRNVRQLHVCSNDFKQSRIEAVKRGELKAEKWPSYPGVGRLTTELLHDLISTLLPAQIIKISNNLVTTAEGASHCRTPLNGSSIKLFSPRAYFLQVIGLPQPLD